MDGRHVHEVLRFSFTWQTGLLQWHYPITRDTATFAQVTHFARETALPPCFSEGPQLRKYKMVTIFKARPRRTWWSCNKSGSFPYQPPFNDRTIALYTKTRAHHQKSTHTSSPQPGEQRFIDDKQGLKAQILIWSQCRCEGSMQQSTLTQTAINITKPPQISFRRVLSSGNCVFQGLQMLGAPQKAAHCRYTSLEPTSKGNSNKSVALAKETSPITLERQKINHF